MSTQIICHPAMRPNTNPAALDALLQLEKITGQQWQREGHRIVLKPATQQAPQP